MEVDRFDNDARNILHNLEKQATEKGEKRVWLSDGDVSSGVQTYTTGLLHCFTAGGRWGLFFFVRVQNVYRFANCCKYGISNFRGRSHELDVTAD